MQKAQNTNVNAHNKPKEIITLEGKKGRGMNLSNVALAYKKTDSYKLLNEGMGGAYERIAYSNRIKAIAERRGCRSLLELNATYIAGVPGVNSCLLVQAGYEVTITVNSRDYEDTVHAWELLGLCDRARIIKWDDGLHNNFFRDESFDLVWNHLAFEHYPEPELLVEEMKRISKDVVINLTLTPHNIGCLIHWLNHKLQGKAWDHGSFRNSTIGAMERVHRECGLEHLESGACDMPPWMDTVDAQIGGSMTYADPFGKKAREAWVWCSADPKCQEHPLTKLFWGWEKTVPEWFRRLVSHHLYVASTRKEISNEEKA